MGRKSKKKRNIMKKYIKTEIYGLIFLVLSFITLAQYGRFGETLALVCRFFTGSFDFVIPLLGIAISVTIMVKGKGPKLSSMRWVGTFLFLFGVLLSAHLMMYNQMVAIERFENPSAVVSVTWERMLQEWVQQEPLQQGGGLLAAVVLFGALHLFEVSGTVLVIVLLMMIGTMLLFNLSYVRILRWVRGRLANVWASVRAKAEDMTVLLAPSAKPREETETADEKTETDVQPNEVQDTQWKTWLQRQKDKASSWMGNKEEPTDVVIHDFTDVAYPHASTQEEVVGDQRDATASPEETHDDEQEEENVSYTNQRTWLEEEEDAKRYRLPPLTLLEKPKSAEKGKEHKGIHSNAEKLKKTLQSFGVQAEVTQIHRGPTVTRYEVQPAIGVKVSKIVNLSDDLALALAARDIRIEAPIPGKPAIGIEVPNTEVALVTQREVLNSTAYQKAESKLSVALGRDISGEPIVVDLTKMPHLLVAGATGSGKSVCINGMITSLLYKAKPHEVKIMMIDPKMVELNVYNGIPHLLSPVVTDSRRAATSLKKVVAEMERRYELFAESGTRDIDRYNRYVATKRDEGESFPFLPYIVVIVDELADLMMVSPADVEDAICRLAQMARAAGIHLIIATQRPSVDVITGVIKANIPSRIAFGVSSQVDSRTILDSSGAEKLLGRGDMLYMPIGANKPTRVQGAFLSEREVDQLVAYVKDQQQAHYQEEMIPEEKESATSESNVEDELYDKAVQTVLGAQRASVSLVQRRLRVGYTRAARLIDAMEENGIVGPYEGSKPREILVKKGESQIS